MASVHEEWNRVTITYYAAVSASENGGQWDQVRPVVDIASAQLKLSTTQFHAAVSACENIGR